MPIDFTEDETTALIDLLVGTIEHHPFPQSPDIQRLRVFSARSGRPLSCRAMRKSRKMLLADVSALLVKPAGFERNEALVIAIVRIVPRMVPAELGGTRDTLVRY